MSYILFVSVISTAASWGLERYGMGDSELFTALNAISEWTWHWIVITFVLGLIEGKMNTDVQKEKKSD